MSVAAAVRTLRLKGLGGTVLKIVVTLGFLAYVFHRVDSGSALATITKTRVSIVCLAAAILSINYVLGGFRWAAVLRSLGQPAPNWLFVQIFWIGALASQVLPSLIGDAVRIGYANRGGLKIGAAIRSSIIERIVMIVTLLLFVCATEPLLRTRVGPTLPAFVEWGLLGFSIAGLVAMPIVCRMVPAMLRANRIYALLAGVAVDVEQFLRSRWLGPTMLLALVSNANFILFAYILGLSLDLPLGWQDYVAIMPVVVVANVLPISIGGWGVREGVLLALLHAKGVSSDKTLAFSLMMGLCFLACSLPALLLLWFARIERNRSTKLNYCKS